MKLICELIGTLVGFDADALCRWSRKYPFSLSSKRREELVNLDCYSKKMSKESDDSRF